MIQNPYPPPKEEDKISCRFQTYLSGEDKGLLSSVRPIRGTPQAVINHLIKNLCNDLRELGITTYHPDADDILTILVEPRPLSADQLTRIRRAVAGTDKQVSAGVRQHSRGTSVHKRPTDSPFGPDHAPFEVVRGKQPDLETKSKTKKSRETKTKRR